MRPKFITRSARRRAGFLLSKHQNHMPTQFTLTTKTRVDTFRDVVSIGDAVTYQIDCTPWQEDNSAISSASWTVECGEAGISGQSLVSGVVSALITFSQSGKALISILLSTATQKKKIWLEVRAKDLNGSADDYGYGE